MNNWYSKYWTKALYKIDDGEWQELDGFITFDVMTCTFHGKTEKYRPTIKQRMNALRDEIKHSVWLDAARHLFFFKQRHESRELDIACGVVAWLQLILLLITWIL